MMNLNKYTKTFSASTSVVTYTASTIEMNGALYGIVWDKPATLPLSTTRVIRILGGSTKTSLCAFYPSSTDKWMFPRATIHKTTGNAGTSNSRTMVPFCNEKVRIRVVASSSKNKINGALTFYFLGKGKF